jgi:methionyl-tRNA formyltransferase
MRVLFWGTPEFAAAPLRALLGEGFDVAGVVTQPDKPQGRGRRVTPPPVKQIAIEEKIPCFQPATPRDAEFGEMLAVMQPDISIVVAYGHILPKKIIELPELGTLNIHASLLPALRGAAPIQAAIRQGLHETGISIMRMVPALDAGPVIHQVATSVLDDETYGELQLRLSELGALALVEALTLISLGEATETPQDESRISYAPKVTRDDARIDWRLDATEVARVIRAYDPRPGAFTTRDGVDVKVFGPRIGKDVPDDSAGDRDPGRVLSAVGELVVACGKGALRITDVQPAGRSRMTAAEWSRGRGISAGDLLGS